MLKNHNKGRAHTFADFFIGVFFFVCVCSLFSLAIVVVVGRAVHALWGYGCGGVRL